MCIHVLPQSQIYYQGDILEDNVARLPVSVTESQESAAWVYSTHHYESGRGTDVQASPTPSQIRLHLGTDIAAGHLEHCMKQRKYVSFDEVLLSSVATTNFSARCQLMVVQCAETPLKKIFVCGSWHDRFSVRIFFPAQMMQESYLLHYSTLMS